MITHCCKSPNLPICYLMDCILVKYHPGARITILLIHPANFTVSPFHFVSYNSLKKKDLSFKKNFRQSLFFLPKNLGFLRVPYSFSATVWEYKWQPQEMQLYPVRLFFLERNFCIPLMISVFIPLCHNVPRQWKDSLLRCITVNYFYILNISLIVWSLSKWCYWNENIIFFFCFLESNSRTYRGNYRAPKGGRSRCLESFYITDHLFVS
jgi:hypothetical protein